METAGPKEKAEAMAISIAKMKRKADEFISV